MEIESIFFNTDDYELTNCHIGCGAFAEIYLVNNHESKPFAAKIFSQSSSFSARDQMVIIREALLMKNIDHPAILKFYGINFHSFDDPSQLQPTILLEYAVNGSLKEILRKEQAGIGDCSWSPTKKYICLLGIADAMRYLHKKGILHRDLKQENILINEDFHPLVCDFGLSRSFSESLTKSMELSMTRNVGTPIYMAPELFEDEEHFGPGIDVYAFAILAYEMVTGIEPYSENGKGITMAKLVRNVLTGRRPRFVDGITDPMKDLLSRCWQEDPKRRPSFEEIFNELSSNFYYLDEDVDEYEVNDYLDLLKDRRQNEDVPKKEDKKEEQKEDQNEAQKEIDQPSNNQELIENERKVYFEMVKELVEKHGKVEDNILHLACKTGNINLVKYVISQNKIDITSKTVYHHYFL